MTPLLVGLALTVAAPAPKEAPKKDAPTVVGTWSVESALKGGQQDNSPPGATLELTPDGKMILHEGGKDIAGTYTTAPKKDPPEIDLTIAAPGAGALTMIGIFKIEGDTLQICLAMTGERPKKLQSPDMAPQVLLTLKRVKKD